MKSLLSCLNSKRAPNVIKELDIHNMDIMVINTITVYSFGFLFNCTMVSHCLHWPKTFISGLMPVLVFGWAHRGSTVISLSLTVCELRTPFLCFITVCSFWFDYFPVSIPCINLEASMGAKQFLCVNNSRIMGENLASKVYLSYCPPLVATAVRSKLILFNKVPVEGFPVSKGLNIKIYKRMRKDKSKQPEMLT